MSEQLFEWSDRYSVNYQPIDNQHKKIIGMLQLLNSDSTGKATSTTAMQVLQELNDYIKVHFRFEEHVMRIIDFPTVDEHKVEHRNLAGRTANICSDFLAEKLTRGELIDFLKEWWVSHILVKDMAYSEYIKRNFSKLRQAETADYLL